MIPPTYLSLPIWVHTDLVIIMGAGLTKLGVAHIESPMPEVYQALYVNGKLSLKSRVRETALVSHDSCHFLILSNS